MKYFRRASVTAIVNMLLIAQGNALAAEADAHSKTGEFWNGMAGRVGQAFTSKDWKELPDEALIPAGKIKWNRLAKEALDLPDWVEFSLSQRTRFESVSHPWRAGQTGGADVQLPLQSRLRLGVNRGPFWLMFEGQDSRTHFADANDFDGSTVTNNFDILQLFGSASFKNINDTGLRADLHAGRLTLQIGSGRLVGRNGYRNTTNSFDGAQFAFGNDKDWRVRTFLTSPVQIDVTQSDHSDTRRMFWGAVFESTQLAWLNSEVYYFGLNDQVNAAQGKYSEFSTFGTRAYRSPAKFSQFRKHDVGAADYEFEAAVQTGDKSGKDFFAYMGHAEIGYTANALWFPRFAGEYDYASGTGDPNGSGNQTFDRLYGVRRTDMMQTGIFGAFFRTNIESVGSRFSVQPRHDVKLFIKHHVWYLAEAKDAFAGSNLADFKPLQDKTGSAGNFLGHDLELVASWKLNSNVQLEAGFEHWFKGDYFKRLPASAGLPVGGQKDTDYFFVNTEFRF